MGRSPNEIDNLNYYFGGDRGYDTLILLMDYQGNRHGRQEVRNFVNRVHGLIHRNIEEYKKWCNSTERPDNECWHDANIRWQRK